jgi:hypothetical protein
MKRLLKVSTLLSAIGFCFLVIIWPVSYHMNLSRSLGSSELTPSDSIAVTPHYRLGFEAGSIWFYRYEMPYRGSIIWISDTNDPPPVVRAWRFGDYGFGHAIYRGTSERMSARDCDLPGIYFRRFWSFDNNPPYTTLRASLWYPLSVLAVLPALWFYRRGHFSFRKS